MNEKQKIPAHHLCLKGKMSDSQCPEENNVNIDGSKFQDCVFWWLLVILKATYYDETIMMNWIRVAPMKSLWIFAPYVTVCEILTLEESRRQCSMMADQWLTNQRPEQACRISRLRGIIIFLFFLSSNLNLCGVMVERYSMSTTLYEN